ncbi:helix-turn-helix domain-containing protein [Bacillus sp. DJP31]|uniref:helix-turn-helix domain-containing protein n=1 Tax=Bacillus sp. DJP31 TaxID=3409789 RepID=UPI003BB5C5E2
MHTLGEKLRLLRMIKNITQKHLADELAIGLNSVGRYENNIRVPKYEMLKKFDDYYGIPIEDLL